MKNLCDFADSVAIVVSSCDAFFDAWRPFAAFFEKFWGDCPLKVFLLTNELQIRSPRMQSIAVGKDRGWSSNLLVALERIAQPYALYFQEDYFLTAPVASLQMAEDFAQVIENQIDSLCFRSRGQPEGLRPLNDRFGVVPLDSDGRTRCQVTLWKRSALQSILRPNESAWDFEARGSSRTQAMQILSYLRRDNTPVPYLMSAISRGLWMPDAIALCHQYKVEIDPFFRPVYSPRRWRRRLQRAIGRTRFQRAFREQRRTAIEL